MIREQQWERQTLMGSMRWWSYPGALDSKFLVSGRDLACQQEVSLALTKTPPIYYYNVVDSVFSNYGGQLRI